MTVPCPSWSWPQCVHDWGQWLGSPQPHWMTCVPEAGHLELKWCGTAAECHSESQHAVCKWRELKWWNPNVRDFIYRECCIYSLLIHIVEITVVRPPIKGHGSVSVSGPWRQFTVLASVVVSAPALKVIEPWHADTFVLARIAVSWSTGRSLVLTNIMGSSGWCVKVLDQRFLIVDLEGKINIQRVRFKWMDQAEADVRLTLWIAPWNPDTTPESGWYARGNPPR